jgi:chromosome partitioning protein
MRVIAVVNQKGGCGKTTTTVNLAASLAADGACVLAIDLDPQAHTTLALGIDPDELMENIYEVLIDPDGSDHLSRVIVGVSERLDLAPSGIVLSAIEQKLAAREGDSPTERLSRAIEKLPLPYDYVLIDCAPNVGLLTFNALRAASEVIVPLETSFFAIDGVQKLLETIGLLSDRLGHDLTVRILPTLYDGRTRYARNTLGEIRELFKDLCFDSVIRINVKLREAAQHGKPICRYAARANGAIDYAALALEVAASAPLAPQAEPDKPTLGPGELREVIVRFRDPSAGDVRIAGDFNGWIPDKGVRSVIESHGETRVWTKILQLPPGTYQYRYVVDGEWKPDPTNPNKVPNPAGKTNSVLVIS